MAKKTTTTKTTAADTAQTVPPAPKAIKAPSGDPPATAKLKAVKKAPLAKAAPTTKAAPAKPPAVRKKAAKPIVRAGFSNEDVALRAYYIAEKRQAAGRPGDTHSDWVEAERQLRDEHGITA
jgi:hypothetical protein